MSKNLESELVEIIEKLKWQLSAREVNGEKVIDRSKELAKALASRLCVEVDEEVIEEILIYGLDRGAESWCVEFGSEHLTKALSTSSAFTVGVKEMGNVSRPIILRYVGC